jgi:hypothetical protein
MEPDTSNDFMIGSNGVAIGTLLPMVITSKQQAYRTAAYIKLMAATLPDEPGDHSYEEIEEAIKNT